MTRLMITFAAAAAVAGGLGALPAPAVAQQATTNAITVFGNDPCPRSTNGEIYICDRRPETERYRLPKSQQLQGTRQQGESWAVKSRALTTVGDTGPQSCSPVGPGGFTGCLTQQINQARRENRDQTQSDQPPK